MAKTYELGISFDGHSTRMSRFLVENLAEGLWHRLIGARDTLRRILAPDGETATDRSIDPLKFEEIRDRVCLDITRNIR